MLLALRRGLVVHAGVREWTPQVPSVPLVRSGDIVALLCAGGIALHVARLLAPFGLRVRVVRRRADEGFAEPHDRVFGDDELREALRAAAALVITLPLTERTRGLVGRSELRLLADGAVVVNVGRGAVLDQQALLPLLEDGTLAGAGLDVTEPEPLPRQDALWAHPRCVITSHTSNPDGWRRSQLAQLVQDNVARFLDGKALRGRVDVDAGY
jgi:phosphoglycerate dehydrogenase-like enzyme